MRKFAVSSTLFSILLPVFVFAYPGGTPLYVTDTGPFCASCHSSVKAEYTPELPAEAAKEQTPEFKHYGLVRSQIPPSPYLELSARQKKDLIKVARYIDKNSSVTLKAPKKVKSGSEIKVTVKAVGGNGPVICVMLVDRALRFQARPVSSDGWTITGEPLVKGQDGQPQTTWLDRRIPSEKNKGLKRNLNFILIYDQVFDMNKNIFPSAEVTYTLKSPSSPGTYTLTAAFLYGTENSDTAGVFQRPSGRILFSKEHKVTVR